MQCDRGPARVPRVAASGRRWNPARVLFDSHRVSRVGDDASMIDDDAGVPESSSFACDASFGATRREGLISRSMSVRYKTTADVALRRRRR